MTQNPKDRAEALNKILAERNSDLTIACEDVWKDNQTRQAYVLRSADRNCTPTAYTDEKWYSMDDEAVVDYLLRIYRENSFNVDVSDNLNREYVREHILPRVLPADNISGLTANGIAYRRYLNLAVIYYLPVDFMNGDASLQITENLLSSLGLTAEDADGFAMKNLASQVDFLTMGSMLNSLIGDDGIAIPPTEDIGMWILTNKSRLFGASVLLYGEKLFAELEEKFHHKVAILPSSVHELIAVPYFDEKQLTDFLAMVVEVNDTQVAEEDLLGNCVYYYDGQSVRLVA